MMHFGNGDKPNILQVELGRQCPDGYSFDSAADSERYPTARERLQSCSSWSWTAEGLPL